MTKTIILPLVTTGFLVVKGLFGVEVDEATVTDVTNGISILVAAGITIYGIIKNHKKEGVK